MFWIQIWYLYFLFVRFFFLLQPTVVLDRYQTVQSCQTKHYQSQKRYKAGVAAMQTTVFPWSSLVWAQQGTSHQDSLIVTWYFAQILQYATKVYITQPQHLLSTQQCQHALPASSQTITDVSFSHLQFGSSGHSIFVLTLNLNYQQHKN